MEIKEEDLYNKLLCLACLCVGREVYKITDEKLMKYYTDAVDEIPLNKSIHFNNLRLCWECKLALQRCWTFKEQVKDSYRIMQSYTSENFHECFHTDISKPPRLNIHNVEPIDIRPSAPVEGWESSVLNLKGEPDNSEVFEDSNTDHFDDEFTSFNSDITESKVFQTELETIVCPLVEDSKRKVKKRNKESRRKTEEATPKEASDPSSDNEQLYQEQQATNGEVAVTWDYGEVETSDQKEEVNKLDTELQTLMSSIEKEGKRRKSKHKKSAQLKLQKTKRENLEAKVITVEMSYEEMLEQREKEKTRDSYVKAEYKCETCLLGFNYKRSYLVHNKQKHSQRLGNYICPICKTVVPSVNAFTLHYKRHMKRYECGICHKRAADLKVMQQHFYSYHEIALKEYKCDICGNISNSIDSHRYHKDSHKARVACTECDKTFRHRAGLNNHRVAVHEYHNAFPCTVCNKVFRWRTSLRRHLDTHGAKNIITAAAPYCSLCSLTFASDCTYKRHLKNSLKHVTQEQHKFICDDCNRRFSDKTKLRNHIEEKHLHKTYQCHICSKTSKNRVGLDQHIRNVHKGRPKNKMCHHCGRGFPTKMQLDSHIRTHTGERPFICEYCPTTFSQKSNLYKHNRQVHLNIKSKRYPLCKKRKEDDVKVPIENGTVDSEPYRPIVIQYSPDGAPTLML